MPWFANARPNTASWTLPSRLCFVFWSLLSGCRRRVCSDFLLMYHWWSADAYSSPIKIKTFDVFMFFAAPRTWPAIKDDLLAACREILSRNLTWQAFCSIVFALSGGIEHGCYFGANMYFVTCFAIVVTVNLSLITVTSTLIGILLSVCSCSMRLECVIISCDIRSIRCVVCSVELCSLGMIKTFLLFLLGVLPESLILGCFTLGVLVL